MIRNRPLDADLKKLLLALMSKEFDETACTELFCTAVVTSIINQNDSVVAELRKFGVAKGGRTFDFDEIDRLILAKHKQSLFNDILRSLLSYRLAGGEGIDQAIHNAIFDAVKAIEVTIKERILSACRTDYCNHEDGLYMIIVNRINEITGNLDTQRIINATYRGDKKEFKRDSRIRTGLDDGPRI